MPYTIQEYLQDSTPTVRAAETYVHTRGRVGCPIGIIGTSSFQIPSPVNKK